MDSTIQKQIIQEEITRYENTVYLWTIRVRIAKKIEDKTLESNAMTELEKCEKSLDVLREELKTL
jgi:hypothetical protein